MRYAILLLLLASLFGAVTLRSVRSKPHATRMMFDPYGPYPYPYPPVEPIPFDPGPDGHHF